MCWADNFKGNYIYLLFCVQYVKVDSNGNKIT